MFLKPTQDNFLKSPVQDLIDLFPFYAVCTLGSSAKTLFLETLLVETSKHHQISHVEEI